MSILMEVLKEEFDRLNREEVVYLQNLQELPKGCISKKKIKGKEYCYREYQEGGKLVSQYISEEDLPKLEAQLKRRKSLEDALSRINKDRCCLQRVLEPIASEPSVLYKAACQIPPSIAMRAVQCAEDDAERAFYVFLADMNLQREQKKVVERDLF